jgi:hypothetical protein
MGRVEGVTMTGPDRSVRSLMMSFVVWALSRRTAGAISGVHVWSAVGRSAQDVWVDVLGGYVSGRLGVIKADGGRHKRRARVVCSRTVSSGVRGDHGGCAEVRVAADMMRRQGGDVLAGARAEKGIWEGTLIFIRTWFRLIFSITESHDEHSMLVTPFFVILKNALIFVYN